MKLHPGASRQVDTVMKKPSQRGQVEKRQWSGGSEGLRGLAARSYGARCAWLRSR